MSVVVTGSNGQLGAWITRAFLATGDSVAGIDSSATSSRDRSISDAATRRAELLTRRLREEFPGFDYHDVDLRQEDAVAAILRSTRPRAIVHATAPSCELRARARPAADFERIAGAVPRLLECWRRHAPEALFLFISSAEVYGPYARELRLLEGGLRLDLPRNHRAYPGLHEDLPASSAGEGLGAASRFAAELLVREHARVFGLRAVILRTGRIAGSLRTHRPRGLLARIAASILCGETAEVRGDPRLVRDVLHGSDLARAVILATRVDDCSGIYNLGGGRANAFSPLEAIQQLEDLLGRRARWSRCESHTQPASWSVLDISRFQEAVPAWRPRRDFDDILEDTIASVASASRA